MRIYDEGPIDRNRVIVAEDELIFAIQASVGNVLRSVNETHELGAVCRRLVNRKVRKVTRLCVVRYELYETTCPSFPI